VFLATLAVPLTLQTPLLCLVCCLLLSGMPAAAELSKWVMSDGEGGGASLLPSPHQARVRPEGRLPVACT
jgi:hypothetical protein